MQIPKEMVVERIRAQADADTASRAESELPDKIDPVSAFYGTQRQENLTLGRSKRGPRA